MSKKIIINAQYGTAIKFKLPFDTQNDAATIEDLKKAILTRLEKQVLSMPQQDQEKFPKNFTSEHFVLQDSSSFQLDDADLVTDLIQPNDLIDLIDRDHLNNSILNSFSQTYIQNASFTNQLQTQTSIQPQQNQDLQPQFPDLFKAPILPPQQPPQQQAPLPSFIPVQDPQPPPQPQVAVSQPQDFGKAITDLKEKFYLNVSNMRNSQQMVAEQDYKLLLSFPQSVDPTESFVFYAGKSNTLLELSQSIARSLGYDDTVTFVLVNHSGHTIHDSMEAIHHLTVEESVGATYEYSNKYFVYATRCNIGVKRLPKINHEEGPHQVFVNINGTKVINVNIETDTVQTLKQKIYSKLDVPTTSQSLSYGGKSMVDTNLLIDYNIQNNSNIVLLYKSSELVPQASSYSYNFYSPWNQFFVQQSEAGQRQFRSHLFALCSHLESTKYVRFLGLIRDLSLNNAPMILTLRNLLARNRLHQIQKIVLEEGLLSLFMTMILNSNDIPLTLTQNNVFEYSRHCFASLLKSSAYPVDVPNNWTYQEIYRAVDNNCAVTGKPITVPALLQSAQDQTEANFLVVDFETVKQKQNNKEKFNNLQIDEMPLTQPKWLREQFRFMRNSKDIICWVPTQEYQPSKETEAIVIFAKDWHTVVDPHPTNPIKIYSSMELKQHPATPVLTLNSKKELVLYTSMNKDIRKPYNLFDVINGAEMPENPDDIAYSNLTGINGTGRKSSTPGNDDEPEIKIEPLITVAPDEAIIVILDISGSMEEQFYNSEDLQRIGAVKAFFNAFADRTMAYNLKHVIALSFFDDRYELKCTFTEVFAQFKELVNRAKPRGMTALYDALIKASDSLNQIKATYPECLLRIIALTDGEDNKSTHKPHEAALKIATNGIILDSFVAGPKSDSLKQIAHATGGKCFCPMDLNEGLKYFEYETILSAKCRVPSKPLEQHQLLSIKSVLASNKNKPFDNQAHDIKIPDQMRKQSVNPVQLVNSLSQDANKFQQVAPNQSLKRVVKEMTNYLKDPHPYIKIFPCEEDISFWKVILLGPEETPYQKGVYTLYIHFSESYPLAAPRFRFFTPIYHCNINQQGRICHSILDRNYTPDTTVKQIFECIYGLLMTPEPDDPLDNTIASEYLQDLPLYRKKAEEHRAQHAQKPLDEVMKGILGGGNSAISQSDEVLHEKIEELQKWIQESLNKQQQQQQQ